MGVAVAILDSMKSEAVRWRTEERPPVDIATGGALWRPAAQRPHWWPPDNLASGGGLRWPQSPWEQLPGPGEENIVYTQKLMEFYYY
jgi:hypothetical protein